MKQIRWVGRGASLVGWLFTDGRGPVLRSRSGSEHHRRLEVDLALRLGHFGKLEAAIQELVGGWSRERENLDVPALELREPPAGSDLGLQHSNVALRHHDLGLDILQRGALGCDTKRHEITAQRRSGATGDHEYGAEASRAHCKLPLEDGAEVRTALLRRADRARGFAASSRSVGDTGLATRSNVGSVGSTSAGR